jgi:hypothetical protein
MQLAPREVSVIEEIRVQRCGHADKLRASISSTSSLQPSLAF